jgi:integrase
MLTQSYAPGTARLRYKIALMACRELIKSGLVDHFDIDRRLTRVPMAPPLRRIYSLEEIDRLLSIASPTLKSCILLGLNLGYGNRDCAMLRNKHICNGFVDAIRHKTGLPRRGWLWPETRQALEISGPPFLNERNGPLVHDTADSLATRFRLIRKHAKVAIDGRGFYSLRRTYRTMADSHPDTAAIDLTMGHSTPGIGRHYVAWISDDRVREVSEHVRSQLFKTESPRPCVLEQQPRPHAAPLTQTSR